MRVPFRLLLVTDRHGTGGRALRDLVEAALAGGADAVQLRERDLGARDLYDLAMGLRPLCVRFGAKLLVNDRIDVARAVGADGIHLPARSFSAPDARQLIGAGRLVGVSTHSRAEAEAAARAGADYVIVGPIFPTPSKAAFGPPLGLATLRATARSLTVPVIGIGGITAANVASVRRAGASGVAVIREILQHPDPTIAARRLVAAFPCIEVEH